MVNYELSIVGIDTDEFGNTETFTDDGERVLCERCQEDEPNNLY